MADAHKNFAYSTVTVAPSPATTGTTMTVTDGSVFPAAPFNCTVWGTGTQPKDTGVTATTAEIVRVTSKGSGNNWTIARQTEPTVSAIARTIVIGDQVAASITAKTLTDIDVVYANSWANYVPAAVGTGVQTLYRNISSAFLSNSLILMPFTLTAPLRFNEVLLPDSLSYSLATVAAQETQNSFFGLYSLSNNSVLNLISASSFSMTASHSSGSMSISWPTTTHTTGWGYGTSAFAGTNSQTIASNWHGGRMVGLQFGGSLSLTGGNYWLGLLHLRTTAGNASYGISHVGIVGQVLHPMNYNGQSAQNSGMPPLGVIFDDMEEKVASVSGWIGRYPTFILQSSVQYFSGTTVPNSIWISQMTAPTASLTATILPNFSFVST